MIYEYLGNMWSRLMFSITNVSWFIYCLYYDFWDLRLSKLDKARRKLKNKEKSACISYNRYIVKSKFYDILYKKHSFLGDDILWAKMFSVGYELKEYKTGLFRSYFRALSTNNGFYFAFNVLRNKSNLLYLIKTIFLSGFKYIWYGVRFWIFPLIVLLTVLYCTLVLKGLPFNKVMFTWIGIIMLLYWLVSGFVFFFKKYQFGKYTTAIQRFWRRSYILFWLIEGGVFLVFLFLTINASQESFYMFDQINIFKTHLYSWRFFFIKIFPLVLLILITYLLLVSLKWNIFSKHTLWLLILTLFLTYTVWLEFYQFYHVLNFYGNLNWIYDVDDHSWSLELEPRRTRIVNHYIMLLFILKFWHIIFIYGFWIFFVLRCWETKRIRYPLLSANFQNFIILYMFAWVFMYPWFKFFFRRFLDAPYYWFYVNNRKLGWRVLSNDFKLLYYSLLDSFYFSKFNFLRNFNYYPFYYWNLSLSSNNFEIYRKHVIRDIVIKNLTNLKS